MCIVSETYDVSVRPVECIYQFDNKLIFYTMNRKKIYIYDKSINKCQEIADLMTEHDYWLFVICIEIDKVLYFVPFSAMDMVEYHLDTGRVDKIHIRSADTDAKYHKVSYYKGKLYFFPSIGYDFLIYEIDSKLKKVCKFEIAEEKVDFLFFLNIYTNHDRVWSVTGIDSNIYCYNMEQERSDIYKLGGNVTSIIDITGENDELFLLTNDGTVFVWDTKNKIERIIKKSDGKIKEPYFAIKYFEDSLWLIPKKDNNVRIIDLYGNVINEWDFSDLRKGNRDLFEAVVQQNNILFLSPFCSNKILIIDMQTYSVETVEIKDIHLNIIQRIDELTKSNIINTKRMVGAYIWEQMKNH